MNKSSELIMESRFIDMVNEIEKCQFKWYDDVKTLNSIGIPSGNKKLLDNFEVFHYTSLEKIKLISETKELWATRIDYLNDYLELENIKKHINNIIAEYEEKITSDSRIKVWFDRFTRVIDKKIDEAKLYVFCSSFNQDSHLMWAYYSDSTGRLNVQIGSLGAIDTCFVKGEKGDIKHLQRSIDNFNIYMHAVYYDETEQRKIVETRMNKLFKLFQCYGDMCKDDQWNFILQKTVDIIAENFFVIAIFFKNKDFEHEQEFRFAFRINSQLVNDYEHTMGEKKIIKLVHQRDNKIYLPFVRVTIGPGNRNSSKVKVVDIRKFLKGLTQNCQIPIDDIQKIRSGSNEIY